MRRCRQRLTTRTSRHLHSLPAAAAGAPSKSDGRRQSNVVDVGNCRLGAESHDAVIIDSLSTHFEITQRHCAHASYRRVCFSPAARLSSAEKACTAVVLFCVATCGREFSRRAQKISPAQAGPSQREETRPVQGQFQDIRVGCACYGQLKLAPPCDFWDTVLKRVRRSIAVMVFCYLLRVQNSHEIIRLPP